MSWRLSARVTQLFSHTFSASFRRRYERHILEQKIGDVMVIVFPDVRVGLEDDSVKYSTENVFHMKQLCVLWCKVFHVSLKINPG